MAHLQQEGVHIAARARPEMCFSDPRDTGGVFFQWSTFSSRSTPASAAPRPTRCPPAGSWRRPRTTPSSARWSTTPSPGPALRRAPGTTVTFEHAEAAPGHPWRASRSATAPSPSSRCRAARPPLWGRPYERAAHPPVGAARRRPGRGDRRAHRAGITIVRWAADLVVLDPAATGGVQVALTGSLLPGDPRL